MTAKTARIPSPMLNNPAPEIKLAPERDAVMATAPRRKSFPPIITEAAPKAKYIEDRQGLQEDWQVQQQSQ